MTVESAWGLMLAMLVLGVGCPVLYLRWRLRRRIMQALLQEARHRIAAQILVELQRPRAASGAATELAEKKTGVP